MKILLALVSLLTFASEAFAGFYDGYKVLEVVPRSGEQLAFSQTLHHQYDVWMEASGEGRAVHVMVPPSKQAHFDFLLKQNQLESVVIVEDVQKLVDSEKRPTERRVLEWTDFHPLQEIYAWLDDQAANIERASVVTVGTTYEGREIKALKIQNGADKPGVILESGIHAREWIGPAATSWIVNEILQSDANSTLSQFNYLYIPNLNPDGYAYTWSNERLWRKTRKPYGNGCIGADPNRNFDDHWLQGGGASANPCSETYGGPEPFSEIETKSYSEYLGKVASQYDIYLAFHSAAQLVLFPWGWTPDPTPLNDLWQKMGDKAAVEIAKVNGTIFTVGETYTTIYPASATSMDWYYGQYNSTLSYTFEMRSGYGFTIPPEFIIPCGKEHLAGLVSLLEDYLAL